MAHRHPHRRHREMDLEPMDDSSDNSNHTWLQDGLNSMQLKRSEMNELIMDYLVHEGFKEAAERFREEAGIEPTNLRPRISDEIDMINNQSDSPPAEPSSGISNNNSISNNGSSKKEQLQQQKNQAQLSSNNLSKNNSAQYQEGVKSKQQQDNDRPTGLDNWLMKIETPEMMDKRVEVRQLIEEGDILKGQSLINLYYPELLDNHRSLYFKLQQQHLIELIRQQKINDVLSFVHDQLSVDESRDLTEMERTLALLAYEHPDKSPYAGLLQTSHRLQLASEINDIILQETTGNVELNKPRLVTLLKLLFWTQSELERKKIQFPKMTDLVNGTIVEPRH